MRNKDRTIIAVRNTNTVLKIFLFWLGNAVPVGGDSFSLESESLPVGEAVKASSHDEEGKH